MVNPVEQNNFMVVGWKVSKTLPKWIHNANSWVVYINEKGADEVEVVEPHEVVTVCVCVLGFRFQGVVVITQFQSLLLPLGKSSPYV
jgi:hypothetical protein